MSGFVYAIECGQSIKIGFTTNLSARLAHIRCHNAFDATPLGQMPGDMQDEKRIHERLAVHRVKGEWFAKAIEVLDFVSDLSPWPNERRPTSPKNPVQTRQIEPSLALKRFLSVVDAYEAATLVSDSTVGSRVFNDGKRVAALRAGSDITVGRHNSAIIWFSKNWPENAAWPDCIARPIARQAA